MFNRISKKFDFNKLEKQLEESGLSYDLFKKFYPFFSQLPDKNKFGGLGLDKDIYKMAERFGLDLIGKIQDLLSKNMLDEEAYNQAVREVNSDRAEIKSKRHQQQFDIEQKKKDIQRNKQDLSSLRGVYKRTNDEYKKQEDISNKAMDKFGRTEQEFSACSLSLGYPSCNCAYGECDTWITKYLDPDIKAREAARKKLPGLQTQLDQLALQMKPLEQADKKLQAELQRLKTQLQQFDNDLQKQKNQAFDDRALYKIPQEQPAKKIAEEDFVEVKQEEVLANENLIMDSVINNNNNENVKTDLLSNDNEDFQVKGTWDYKKTKKDKLTTFEKYEKETKAPGFLSLFGMKDSATKHKNFRIQHEYMPECSL